MKKLLVLSLFIIALTLLVSSCGKKGEAQEITGMTQYEDPVVKFGIKYPTNWMMQSVPGSRFLCFSTQGAKERFMQYEGKGVACAKIEIFVQKLDSGRTLDSFMLATKIFTPDKYTAAQKVKIDGIDGFKQTYSFELEDGIFNGEVYYAQKDPHYVAAIFFEAFAGTLDAYRKNIDEMVASIKLPATPQAKQDTIFKKQEQEPPSKVMTTKGGDGYSIEIPDNFRAEASKAAGTLSSRNYIGNRRADCNIQIDAVDATKQKNLKKIVDENSPKYKSAKPQDTKIGGQQAYVMAYSFKKDVMSKVYFVIKGNKLYKITMNWYKPEEADYLPIFEKSIQSIKFQ